MNRPSMRHAFGTSGVKYLSPMAFYVVASKKVMSRRARLCFIGKSKMESTTPEKGSSDVKCIFRGFFWQKKMAGVGFGVKKGQENSRNEFKICTIKKWNPSKSTTK